MSLHISNPPVMTPGTSQYVGQDGATASGSWAHNSSSYTPSDGVTPSIMTNPSRKRSRDESAFDTGADNSYFSFPSTQQVSTPASIPEEEPIYGEGMVLLNPKTGQPLSAESQTGTWYEEKVADEENRRNLEEGVAAEQAEKLIRPTMPLGRKSIRMSQSSIRADMEPIIPNGAPASPPKSSGERAEADEATIALGIGWTKMASEDPDLQAAARGWTKYIENHYRSIHTPEIMLKSRSLNAYLVSAQEGFFLFSEDLLEGKLVGKTWETCLQNLKSVPMVFDSDQVLKAERTPGPDGPAGGSSVEEHMANWQTFNPLSAQTQHQPKTVVVDGNGGMDLD